MAEYLSARSARSIIPSMDGRKPGEGYYGARVMFNGWNKFEGRPPTPDSLTISFNSMGRSYEVVQYFNPDGTPKEHITSVDGRITRNTGQVSGPIGPSDKVRAENIVDEALRRYRSGDNSIIPYQAPDHPEKKNYVAPTPTATPARSTPLPSDMVMRSNTDAASLRGKDPSPGLR